MRRAIVIAVSIGVICGLGGFIAIVLYKRQETGSWQMPTGDDLIRVKAKLVRQGPAGPSKIIYLERNGVTLRGGIDDAPNGVSSVVAQSGLEQVTLPGFTGSDAAWRWIVTCVGKKFEPFDVLVTDQRPASADFLMVAVGGKATDLDRKKHRHAGGLAPFNSKVIPNAVVFAFSASLGNRKRPVCEVIGMEVAHAYGLDHGYHCRDLMTYLPDCGYRRFQDLDVPCGESKKRPCANGQPTQNSYRHLLNILGPAKPQAD